MANTTNELVAVLRRVATPFECIGKCSGCAYRAADVPFGDDFEVCDRVRLHTDAADKIEELVDRCARYAEEIAVLREERKRTYGRWEPCFDENEHWRQGIGKCSECGQEFYAHAINRYNFCPMCGTKMGGGEYHGG